MLRAVLVALMVVLPGMAGADDLYSASIGCAPQVHAELPQGIAKVDYPKARPMLIAAGWKPLSRGSREYTIPEKWAVEAGYTEVVQCAGTGANPCAFDFSDAQTNILRVITRGDPPGVVTDSFFVCD